MPTELRRSIHALCLMALVQLSGCATQSAGGNAPVSAGGAAAEPGAAAAAVQSTPSGDAAAASADSALAEILAQRRRGDFPEIELGDFWFTVTEQARIGSDARSDYERALGLLRQSRFNEGIALLESVTASTPEATAPYIDLGIAHGEVGNFESAERALTTAGHLSPDNPVVHNELGILYRRTGRFADARASYEKALAVFGEYHYARRNLAVLCDLYLADSACALANYRAYLDSVGSDAEVEIWLADLETRVAN